MVFAFVCLFVWLFLAILQAEPPHQSSNSKDDQLPVTTKQVILVCSTKTFLFKHLNFELKLQKPLSFGPVGAYPLDPPGDSMYLEPLCFLDQPFMGPREEREGQSFLGGRSPQLHHFSPWVQVVTNLPDVGQRLCSGESVGIHLGEPMCIKPKSQTQPSKKGSCKRRRASVPRGPPHLPSLPPQPHKRRVPGIMTTIYTFSWTMTVCGCQH